MDTKLFRKEATDAFFSGEARAGLLTIAPPTSLAIFAVLTALFIVLTLFATFGHVNVYAEGPGVVRPSEPPIVLRAPFTAFVRVVARTAGGRAHAGELLVELDARTEEAERTKCVQDLDAASKELVSLERLSKDSSGSPSRDRDAALAMVLSFQVRAQRDDVHLVAQRCKDLDRIVERSRIVVPVDAILEGVLATPGAQVREGDVLATMLPATAELIGYLALPEQHRSELATGSTVRLKFDAFPSDEVGTGTGTVHRILDALPPGVKLDAPGASALYAEIAITTMPKGAVPRSGMTFVGDVLARRGRVADLLFGRAGNDGP